MKAIMVRSRILINTDPQRRCYNGAHFSYELQWTEWEILERVKEKDAERKLTFWTELNDYAVSQRGESAKRELKLVNLSEALT